ncbi:uncharacterized protein BDZ99DRAFT_458242 [Mytilinidion resinicola]|uniref:Uncharacterized protein n=1 Tax=Mytilinidion resinicola TaxID=574789 RepID=A0A6A6Z7S0_9PEZI|nr:uncharacterized protein BDZ99DRAFT_458242 [Mytilinidion resinicola]KAF2816364.1 hypothetical protein BDZ99DRAFT_458242 [Mytilinidion resinicola]
MPPPVTPSPHRFLPPREPRVPKPSALRNGIQAQQQTPAQARGFAPIAHAEHVTPARRFTFASRSASNSEKSAAEPTQQGRTQTPRPTRKLKRVESIDDASQGTTAGDSDEEQYNGVDKNPQEEDEDENELLFGPSQHKRRRLSLAQASIENIINTPTAHPPSTPALASYRFLPQRTPVPAADPTTPVAARPTFLLPSHTSSSPPSHPLPEAFSPQRRGQKYVPGGLASTARNWIMEVAHTTNSSAKSGAGDGYRVKLRVSDLSTGNDPARLDSEHVVENSHGGMLLIQGALEPERDYGTGTEARAILARHSGRKSAPLRVRLGSIVGIRAPWWDVEIRGKKWIVVADWGVV